MRATTTQTGCQPGPGGALASLGRLAEAITNGLLPTRCLFCGLPAGASSACGPCLEGLPANLMACRLCALPLRGGPGTTCGSCQVKPPLWSGACAPLAYEFPVDVMVKALKFRRNLVAARVLAGVMLEHAPPGLVQPGSVLIPVPLHWTRAMQRGYNQAWELARHLSRATGLALNGRQLLRHHRTRAQTGLGSRARRRNLDQAFSWRGKSLDKARAILVDDVMTTGSTARACTRILRHAGAGSVHVWIAARAL